MAEQVAETSVNLILASPLSGPRIRPGLWLPAPACR